MISTRRRIGEGRPARSPRLIASAALGAAVVLGATGCTFLTPQSTTIQYSAAEGVNVFDSGPLEVRNAFIVADETGAVGNFVAAVVNPTDTAHTLVVELGEGSTIDLELRVPARTTISLGADGEEPLLVEGLDTPPGANIPGYFQSGDAEGMLLAVPVLDGELEYLAPLVPRD
ncbi:DNA modification methylase [Microbacterium aurantiacum]|uniref:DNA modification methylase n=1 Tax=Microbacterium aurantiacum TaxID=162393 RepID=UPI000AFB2CCE|nr:MULTISPECIES: DNA modification methylase [Microbacterium]